jgi:hypothetical protein
MNENDSAASLVRSDALLAHADECFRDIRERLEHAGTNKTMRTDIHTICNRWWASRKANAPGHLRDRSAAEGT